MPTGIPRPSSVTSTPPSSMRRTMTLEACPAMASSTELSTTSQIRWCKPRGPVEPIYIPRRLRTASKPSRIVIDPALYSRSEEHTSELQSRFDLVCRLLLEKKKIKQELEPIRQNNSKHRLPQR